MTDERDEDERGHERHSFRSATISATDDQIVDDEGHKFEKGKLSEHDEADRA